MKSALFVDFDNVYSGLRRLDPASADRFALQPMAWMEWLTRSLELPDYSPEGARRRVLVRRCYLNPQAYQRFRPAFNLAGFEIVDCPALTSEGKTSTDIHMVLDIVDLLEHQARYDEFIVFSADADFTPVLRKLRRWDRRTTVLAIGFPSAAYRASADLLIDQDEFVRKALGLEEESEAPSTEAAKPSRETADKAVTLIRQIISESSAPVPLARVASLVLARIDGMDAATWAGFGSFRALLESRSLSPLAITWEGGGSIHDPKRHAVTPAIPTQASLASDGLPRFGCIRSVLGLDKRSVRTARTVSELRDHIAQPLLQRILGLLAAHAATPSCQPARGTPLPGMSRAFSLETSPCKTSKTQTSRPGLASAATSEPPGATGRTDNIPASG